jgi:GT2 family glycosyltransferase
MKSISVIVTNWNGQRLLEKHLETVIQNSPQAGEIILSDDASTDASLDYARTLQKKYPQLKIIHHRRNLGFGANSNFAVGKAQGELVVLLNSDIHPHPNYLLPSLKHFSHSQVFGVGFCEDNNPNWGRFFWQEGYLQYQPGAPTATPHITGWVSGGSSIIRKDLFLKLGGFDPVYQPFYSEDLDLGYRAWKSGYRLFWEPQSHVVHQHESTMSKFSRNLLNYVKERNRLLTVWRNISDTDLLWSNRRALFFRVLTGPNYIKIIRAAKKQISQYPPAVVFPKINDRQIFDLFHE